MNKFKIGDNVKTIYNCGYHIPGFKLGIISKITDISEDNNFKYCINFENKHFWCKENELELVIEKNYTFEEFKKCPVGTKITFEKRRDFT
jgi:hypothetical protein